MQPLTFTAAVDRLIDLALEEDVGTGDITTDPLVAQEIEAEGTIKAKQDLTIAGLDVARRVFQRLDADVRFQPNFKDGDTVPKGQTVVALSGRLSALLTAERTALNFLQRLSGIATHVRTYVNALQGTSTRLLDTRKTTPGWRVLEKYAVRAGGGSNHRMGLYDGVLIKDNHIAACGSIAVAVARVRARVSHLVKIEVETTTMDEVQQALDAGTDIIMLDNMDKERIKAAVALINRQALVEVSGGVTLTQLTELAQTGVDLISVGALTHSAQAVDLSMYINPCMGKIK